MLKVGYEAHALPGPTVKGLRTLYGRIQGFSKRLRLRNSGPVFLICLRIDWTQPYLRLSSGGEPLRANRTARQAICIARFKAAPSAASSRTRIPAELGSRVHPMTASRSAQSIFRSAAKIASVDSMPATTTVPCAAKTPGLKRQTSTQWRRAFRDERCVGQLFDPKGSESRRNAGRFERT